MLWMRSRLLSKKMWYICMYKEWTVAITTTTGTRMKMTSKEEHYTSMVHGTVSCFFRSLSLPLSFHFIRHILCLFSLLFFLLFIYLFVLFTLSLLFVSLILTNSQKYIQMNNLHRDYHCVLLASQCDFFFLSFCCLF